jgi:hypothetical protein
MMHDADNQIVEEETGREREMRSQLEDMCLLYAGLETLNTWPDELQYEPLINRALDIRSSFMQYLAVQIEHANTPLGKAGMLWIFLSRLIF